MSKKDYQALAKAVYATRQACQDSEPDLLRDGQLYAMQHVTRELCDTLSADNPRFDRARFVEACETGRCKGMRQVGAGA